MLKYKIPLIYAFFYGLLVAMLSGLFFFLPWSMSLEYQLYGYTSPFKDPYSFSNRYYKYRTDDSSYYSVPYLIQKQISSQPEKNLYEKGLTELKFILRNEDVLNKERAILVYDAKYMLDGRMTKENVKSVIEDKIVFIGLFDNNYKTKHGLTIDKFLTPVQPDMSGSMLLVNAWLNLAAGGLVRVSPVLLIFLFNFIVALIMSIWYQSVRGKQWSAMITLFINLGISLILFPVVGLLLFFFLEVKLALGISLLLFQYHYQIFVYIKEKNISDAKNN